MAIYCDFRLQKMNLGPITKLKTPVAVTKYNVEKGFSVYPRAGIFPRRCLPRLSSSL